MMDDKETNQIILTVKELFKKNTGNRTELSKLIDKYLIPQELEKKTNAEVSTPYKLRQDMLDKIPDNFWTDIHRVFEPCSGKGGFLIDILDRFMIGLKDKIIDDQVRYKTIVEQCLYWSDINPTNIFICKLLLDPDNKYKLNYNEGDTLKINIFDKFGFDHFDAVIGNPPYQDTSGNKGKGHALWVKFVESSINIWLEQDGYLLFVHPSLWRQLDNSLLKLIKSKQLIYLEIHNSNDGRKTFNCSTRYDWYILQNKDYSYNTVIKDEIGIIHDINLQGWSFIPNMMFDDIKKLVDDNHQNKLQVFKHRSDYGTEKKWISKIKNDEFKYPIIYSINIKNKLSLVYSNTDKKGHFGLSKFIFSNGAGFYCDSDGSYGLSEWSYCIYDDKENLNDIEKAFRSKKFNDIKKAIHLDSCTYNIKVMKLFRKDFYKEFI